jgi:hypothetical protein
VVSDTVQPGAEVDAALWRRFRQAVEQQTGGLRGHLRAELETALRLYIADESELSAVKVNRRLARIESELGIAEADGGADTFEADRHAHAPTWTAGDPKPSANAPTDKKVAYLADQLGPVENEISEKALRATVKDEYGFKSETATRYVGLLVDHFDLVDHPEIDSLLVTDQRRRELLEAEADAELEATDR